jgi:bacteriocin biosynthesis cyclodehydratase domain-containing protein
LAIASPDSSGLLLRRTASCGSAPAARPRFKSCVEPIVSSNGELFLLSEGRNAWIVDPVYAAVAPMLDGTHDVEAIFAALSETYPVGQVFAALDRLRASGYLTEDAAVETRPMMAFWEYGGVRPSLARSRLDAMLVSTIAFGDADAGPLTDLLTRDGIRVGTKGDFTVVITDDYLRPELATWNTDALKSGKAWLLVKPVGMEPWIGPMILPGQTACWDCLAQRLRGHRRFEEYIARRNVANGLVGPVPAYIASTQYAVLSEAATEITRWIGTGGQSILLDRVVSTSILTLERTHHNLIRRVQCRSCGSPEPKYNAPPGTLSLRSRPKIFASDGGHRALDQREVLAQLEQHLSPITGIVSSLKPGDRAGQIHRDGTCVTATFAADHSFSDMYDDRFFLKEGMRRRSGGKGKSVDQARISALAESLERYCGVFDGTEARIRASFAELGTTAIHPNACMLYSERQYANRQSYNSRGHKAYWVPEPFRHDVEIEWTPLWSLSNKQTRYLPTSLCYYGYQSPAPLFARADSNGCAAGSALEEAVLQGVLELIERDAVALWWYNRLRRRAVDLESADDAYVAAIIRRYGDLRRYLWALDVTSDVGIPTFVALSRRVDKAEEDIIYGFGAHLDPKVALSRALTEMNQSLEAVPTAAGPESSRTYRGGGEAVHWWRTVRSTDANYLVPDPQAGPLLLDDFKNGASDDLCGDVFTCVGLAANRGIEVLVLDQTRPDVGFPVVRVVAPGLRHFWARFGPGRLYDVPVREGWLSRPLNEGELNPFVIQF